jgi:hypothetical protein
LAYLNYHTFWGIKENGEKWIGFSAGNIWFKYLQIPLNVRYAIPLWKSNFRVYGKLGFSLNIPSFKFNHNATEIQTTFPKHEEGVMPIYYFEYTHTAKLYDRSLNILLNAGIGFEYRFKNAWGLFAEGEYYAGLRTMGHVYIDVKQIPNGVIPYVQNEYKELLLIKGNYWNFNLGVSYNFKQKKKT